MSGIIEYLKDYDYKFFDTYPFNEVDGLCFANLTYAYFENVFTDNDQLNGLDLHTIAKRFLKNIGNRDYVRAFNDYNFVKVMADCHRYKDAKCLYYESSFDVKEEKQFAALCIDIGKYIVVSYRGTDGSVIGWKEDFNMSFENIVPSQKLALTYLNRVIKNFNKKIIVVGHSKGGNLAQYATLKLSLKNRKRIERIYSFDAPGFNEITYRYFEDSKLNISSFAPVSSVIGLLMENNHHNIYIDAKGFYLFQHDPYLWYVDDNHFVRVSDNDSVSKFTAQAIDNLMGKVSFEERRHFIDTMFEIVNVSKAYWADDVIMGLIKNHHELFELLKVQDDRTKKIIDMVLRLSFESIKDTATLSIKNTLNDIFKQMK